MTFPSSCFGRCFYVVMLPMKIVFHFTVPDCKRPGCWRKLYIPTFLICIAWIAVMSYIIVWMVTLIGNARHNRKYPCRVGLVVSVSASHVESRGFAPRSGHTKDHHKNGADLLPAWHACIRVGDCSPTVLKHLKDLGINRKSRVSYSGPDFYLVLHGLRCRKSTIMD